MPQEDHQSSSLGENDDSLPRENPIESVNNSQRQRDRRWSDDVGTHNSTIEDDDDDEDNWSRKVETDDILQPMPSSVVSGGDAHTIDDEDERHCQSLLPQPRPQPTLKEKLVERERQRRVESERARWKRQFAMAAHAELEPENNPGTASMDTHRNLPSQNSTVSNAAYTEASINDRNSVAGTVGEDTVAPIETLEEDTNDHSNTNMNYPMERFLQEQHDGTSGRSDTREKKKDTTHQVVMERFLLDQPQAAPSSFGTETNPGDSPSGPSRGPLGETVVEPESSVNDHRNNATDLPHNHPSSPSLHQRLLDGDDTIYQSPSQEPRVILRLTEAEIQEMAAIDDASRSNAPPSERDDISELGELVSDFGMTPLHLLDSQNMSQGTPVTAMESVTSSVENNTSQQQEIIEHIVVLDSNNPNHSSRASSDRCMDEISQGHSVVSSNIVDAASSAGGDDDDVSLTGNPPSEIARDEDDANDVGELLGLPSSQVPSEILPSATSIAEEELRMPILTTAGLPSGNTGLNNDSDNFQLEQNAANESIVNRKLRPGILPYKATNHIFDPKTPPPKIQGTTNPSQNENVHMDAAGHHIEGFDFDKNEYSPSISRGQGDLVFARNALWSPGLSPDRDERLGRESLPLTHPNEYHGYGAMDGTLDAMEHNQEEPLLVGIPPAVRIDMGGKRGRESSRASILSIRSIGDLNSLCDSVFSDIRSESTATRLSISNEAEEYKSCSILQRAFPERMFALTVTLIFELPTLFLISGGSDQLCALIGRTRYTTLVALLPIVSAISGNVGLQASTLTTRAISHGQVKVENYSSWLTKEVGAAFYLGLGMGAVTGTIAFLMGGFSIAFALSIFTAQFIGIVTAGCTGTVAPLLFTFIFERDSGKWGGPLETAVQDVVGSFAMIVISYRIMLLFGPYELESNDMCGAVV